MDNLIVILAIFGAVAIAAAVILLGGVAVCGSL